MTLGPDTCDEGSPWHCKHKCFVEKLVLFVVHSGDTLTFKMQHDKDRKRQ